MKKALFSLFPLSCPSLPLPPSFPVVVFLFPPLYPKKNVSVIFQEFFLIGGLDQNLAAPGFTFLMGLRVAPGIEFGAGPNILFDVSELGEDKPEAKSVVKTAFVLGIGMSLPAGRFNFPINIAFTPSSTGLRTTIITGVSW